MNYVKSIISGQNDYSSKVKHFLKEYGNVPIDTITIFRNPLPSFYSLTGNLISHNKLQYDKLFHLGLRVGLKNGKVLTVEKNEVINIDNFKQKPKAELLSVDVPFSNLTTNEMLNKTKALMGDKYFKYKAQDNNCQFFAMNVLKANNLLKPEYQSFIMQNVQYLFENKLLRKTTNVLTNIGGVKTMIQGGKLKKSHQLTALSDVELKQMLGKKIIGVYMKDKLPKKLKNGWYIVNMQSSNVGNGTHWVCFHNINNNLFYFDSYGIEPPLEILKNANSCYYNVNEIQSYNSQACGWFCVALILYYFKFHNTDSFFKCFSADTRKNDENLYNLLKIF